MREIRQSGSEGGARFYSSFLPLSGQIETLTLAIPAIASFGCVSTFFPL